MFLRNIFDYMTESNYVSVGKKHSDEKSESLSDVFQKSATDHYGDYRQKTEAKLIDIRRRLVWHSNKLGDLDVYSIAKLKEKELLQREEADLHAQLGKIDYLIGERYNFIKNCFSFFVIFVIPLFVVLIMYLFYALYNLIIEKKAKEYCNA